jgi:hypothetical protein
MRPEFCGAIATEEPRLVKRDSIDFDDLENGDATPASAWSSTRDAQLAGDAKKPRRLGSAAVAKIVSATIAPARQQPPASGGRTLIGGRAIGRTIAALIHEALELLAILRTTDIVDESREFAVRFL